MGYSYLYTGTGAGKTANALGLALRSVGHKRKVVVVQFLKWWKNTGEYKIRGVLAPYYEVYLFGRKGWIGLDSLDERDRRLAEKGLKFAEKVAREKKPHLLVLDEINLVLHCKLLKTEEVINLLDKLPQRTNVVLTGRCAPKELIDKVDFVNELIDTKYPMEIVTTKGVQY
jgi:cob(I)alamin adenosyltransferase